MLDIRRIREQEDLVRVGLQHKQVDVDLDALLETDRRRRELLTAVEALKNERNVVSKEIGRLKKAGEDATAKQDAMRDVGRRIQEMDQEVREVGEQLQEQLLAVPNIPHESAPVGSDESANREVRSWGEPRTPGIHPTMCMPPPWWR
jgi:seryl-tRNA synthetase